ncbi:MAG: bifunctional nuclease family protein [Coriobacteriia bacterium]
MLQIRIAGLTLDATTEQPVLLLAPVTDGAEPHNSHRALPIWIGNSEATAILLAVQGIEPPRPMTHDLLKDAIETAGFTLARIEITRLDEGTFFATLVLRSDEREVELDARPSDSVALALRFACPMYVSQRVFDEAAVEVTEVDEEEEVAAFRHFLENIDPSDFMS